MSIQLVVLFLLLTLTLFVLLVYFEKSLGPIKWRLKVIKYQDETLNHLNNVRQHKPDQTTFNHNSYNIKDINETDYEEFWNNRTDYWLHNWGNQHPPSQIPPPLDINKANITKRKEIKNLIIKKQREYTIRTYLKKNHQKLYMNS